MVIRTQLASMTNIPGDRLKSWLKILNNRRSHRPKKTSNKPESTPSLTMYDLSQPLLLKLGEIPL